MTAMTVGDLRRQLLRNEAVSDDTLLLIADEMGRKFPVLSLQLGGYGGLVLSTDDDQFDDLEDADFDDTEWGEEFDEDYEL